MGAWDTGPFDNDHAADFASTVIDMSGAEARSDLFMITFLAVADTPEDHFYSRCTPGYELPYEFESVIASAAYLADRLTGKRRWTDTPYATDAQNRPPEIDQATPAMIGTAVNALTKVLLISEKQGIEPQWREAPWLILEELKCHG